jgi:hypothetical protein
MHIISSAMATLVRLNSPERHSHTHYATCWKEAAASIGPPPALPPPPIGPNLFRTRRSALNRLRTIPHYLAWAGLSITLNLAHRPIRTGYPIHDISPDHPHTTIATFAGEQCPLADFPPTHLWGLNIPPPLSPATRIIAATDGSTKDGLLSSASLVICDDAGPSKNPLPVNEAWTINTCNNYNAELSGICAAITSAPLSWPITVHIDNLSAIQAVLGASSLSHIPIRRQLRTAGRPYVIMASRAIRARALHATANNLESKDHTILNHVRSHTKANDTPSLLNEAADTSAKKKLAMTPAVIMTLTPTNTNYFSPFPSLAPTNLSTVTCGLLSAKPSPNVNGATGPNTTPHPQMGPTWP